MKLARKLREAFEEAKKRDRSFERALHFRAAMLRLEEELFEALVSEESEEASERFIETHKEALKRLAEEEEIENDWDVTPYGEQK